MPTHQGKSQTDIVIGDGGDSCSAEAFFEFAASYGSSANFQYKRNNSSSDDDEDSSYELRVLDASGATIASFFAKYTCEPVTGIATDVDSTRTHTFNPSANGANPGAIPTSRQTYANRSWANSVKKNGQSFASYQANWELASTVATGGSVTQSVTTQNNDELEVSLTYVVGGSTVLSLVVTCYALVAISSANLVLGTPGVTDTIQP